MMNLFSVDFDELLLNDFWAHSQQINFTEEELTELTGQADQAIARESENPQELAAAYVKKFQLLTYQHKLAPKLLEKALALCPDMPQALIRMGMFFYKKDRDNGKTLEYINKVIETSPSFADAYLLRAYLSENNREQIMSDCAEYSRLKPGSSLGYEKCGYFLNPLITHNFDKKPDDQVKHDAEAAIYNYTEAIRLNPSNCNNYIERGELFLLKDKFFGAQQDHNNALSDIINFFLMFPEDDLDQYKICFNNLFCDVNLSLEEQYYTGIINTVSPEKSLYWFAYRALAECYHMRRYNKKSIAFYSSMIERNPNGSVFQLLGLSDRASVYRDIDEYDKALDDYAFIVDHGSWVIKEYERNEKNFISKIPWEICPMNVFFMRANIFRLYKARLGKDASLELEMNQKAITEYSKAIELAELADDGFWLADYYRKRADLYNEISEFDSDIEDYSAIIKLGKKGNWFCLTHAYKQRKKL
jgi:tetratricopeptide (TPR) repeat protein